MPDITKGKTFSSGDTVTAADLNNLVDDASINDNAINSDKIASGAVTNAKVSASAAISFSKLESLATGSVIVGDSGSAKGVALSGDATIDASGAITVSNSASATTATTVSDNAITLAKLEDATQGDLLYYASAGEPARLSAGTSGQFLKTQGSAANPVWSDLDAGTVKKYSSGWTQTVNSVSVADGATLTVPHALSTADVIVQVWANDSDSDSGAQQVVNQEWAGSGSFFYGAYVQSPSSSEVVVQLSAQGYIKGSSSGNTPSTTSWTGDYIKIIVMG
tara:strand:- start:71 stop:904 length:834 start_codon:yes stop_codon:yes gene_type:complete